MSTIKEFDDEVAAQLIIQTTLQTRMLNNYDPLAGEQIPDGEYWFRLRSDAFQSDTLDSNQTKYIVRAQIDWVCKIPGVSHDDSTQRVNAWLDQQVMLDSTFQGFWKELATVYDVVIETPPQVSSVLERVGQALRFTVTALIVLQ